MGMMGNDAFGRPTASMTKVSFEACGLHMTARHYVDNFGAEYIDVDFARADGTRAYVYDVSPVDGATFARCNETGAIVEYIYVRDQGGRKTGEREFRDHHLFQHIQRVLAFCRDMRYSNS
jgi:hypothetical protein|uniref:Uncharacterized protein n=1 Tax=Myoviridae sp. ctqfO1 TaxID=2827710 RepID=A0A8S5T2K4_9CAUD|nr:MAG TPA: hypothetical protein [Myoviridae sp. ctqfO1]